MKFPRLYFKNLVCLLRLAAFFGLIEYCRDCGRKQPLTWWADDRLWLLLNGGSGGALCPECFDKRALKRHILLRWKPELHPVHDKAEVEAIFRHGRGCQYPD